MDFYIVLGVDRDATLNDIKRAYKRLARRFHPDINPGDRMAATHFREITEAYETLSDPERRRRYDSTGIAVDAAAAANYGFEGFDFSVRVSGADASTFGDLFADVFQRDVRRPAAVERGADLHQTLTVGFDAAMRGGQYPIAVTRQEHCRMCTVDGRPQAPESRCPHCQGTGSVRSARGHMVFSRPCTHCGGLGRVRQARCPACGGTQVE